MQVRLLSNTPLWICSDAIRQCHSTIHKSDKFSRNTVLYAGERDRELIIRVGNKMKHGSTLEHLVYSFDINGVSRALLQELARHRIASPTVKSTRYTLKELKNEEDFATVDIAWNNGVPYIKRTVTADAYSRADKYIVTGSSNQVNEASMFALQNLKDCIESGISNDLAKYCLPESYKTSLTWTINARSLQNFLELRSNKSALKEIQNLAQAVFEKLPKDHQYLFEDNMYALEEKTTTVIGS